MRGPCRVLLVEDHVDTRQALLRLLTRSGFEVVTAGSVAEGIAVSEGQAAALLDFQLPDGLGSQVLDHIKKSHPAMRTAFLTAAFFSDEVMPKLKKADRIFTKPIDIRKLIEWLETIE